MSVLIGTCDQRVSEDEQLTPFTNKIGGKPDFYNATSTFPVPTCCLCGKPLLLVMQLYCPLDDSPYDRTMYLFGCATSSCWNKDRSWRVIRSQQLSASNKKLETKAVKKAFEDTWCDSADDWGEPADSVTTATDRPTLNADSWDVAENDWGDDMDEEKDNLDTISDMSESVKSRKSEGAKNDLDLNQGDLDIDGAELEIGAGDLDVDFKQMNIDDDSNSAADGELLSHCQPEDVVTMESCNQSILGSILKVKQDKEEIADSSMMGSLSERVLENAFVACYLSAFEEPTSASLRDKHVQKLMKDYSRREGCNVENMLQDNESASGEKYEKSATRHGDNIFHKFMKRVSLCPQQCLRYSWCGEPLPISKLNPTQGVPKCSCGSVRVFELQLMPALVSLLKYSEEAVSSNPPIEFGTVLVFTCPRSCWKENDTGKEECVIVQADPDQHLFKC